MPECCAQLQLSKALYVLTGDYFRSLLGSRTFSLHRAARASHRFSQHATRRRLHLGAAFSTINNRVRQRNNQLRANYRRIKAAARGAKAAVRARYLSILAAILRPLWISREQMGSMVCLERQSASLLSIFWTPWQVQNNTLRVFQCQSHPSQHSTCFASESPSINRAFGSSY